MAKKKVTGVWRLCGHYGELTFEHVPPRAAFNSRPAVLLHWQDALGVLPRDAKRRGRILQRGAGAYCLCAPCNNNTGAWYGSRFVEWCVQGMELLHRTEGRPSLIYLNYLFPLATLKQVLTMFVAINGERFHLANPELQAFLLDKERKYLPPRYRAFVYFTGAGRWRHHPVTGVADIFGGRFSAFSEITFPPYGYVLTWRDAPPHPEMFEISHFARYDYEEWTPMEVRLPVLDTHTGYPGDYRDLETIRREAELQTDTDA